MYNLTINKMKNRKEICFSDNAETSKLYCVHVSSNGEIRRYFFDNRLEAKSFIKGLSFSEYAYVSLSCEVISKFYLNVYEYNEDKRVSARPSKRRQR